MAAAALNESGAVAHYDEFNLVTKHEDPLLGGRLNDCVSGVNYGNQNRARRHAKYVCGILLPVWSHSEECVGEGRVASNFTVEVVVVISASVGIGSGDLVELYPCPAFRQSEVSTTQNATNNLSVWCDLIEWNCAIEEK